MNFENIEKVRAHLKSKVYIFVEIHNDGYIYWFYDQRGVGHILTIDNSGRGIR